MINLHSPRLKWFIAIAVATLVVLTLIAAPTTQRRYSGSTYSRNPDGYGAWYAYMLERQSQIDRWRQPYGNLFELTGSNHTLLRVNSLFLDTHLSVVERDWVTQGNTLVVLGRHKDATTAPFTRFLESPAGLVEIQTTRRSPFESQTLLGDEYGAVVWQTRLGKGKVIYATTPHLAANAYQDSDGNFEFLAQLVGAKDRTIWVDEYVRGFRDLDPQSAGQTEDNLLSYFAKTPLLVVAIQGGIILLVTIYAGNYRFGKARSPQPPVVENSRAYIEALAKVLHKAESSEFIYEVVGKAERQNLQKSLGLGNTLLPEAALIEAWVKQSGQSDRDLATALKMQSRKRRGSDRDILAWLEHWKRVRS